MNPVQNQCQCCGEDCPSVVFVSILCAVCPDCEEGQRMGKAALAAVGVSSVFIGPCGDYPEGFKP